MSRLSVKDNRKYDNSARVQQARDTRHRALEATYQLLINRGYKATTIKAVATEARISEGTIYKSFGSKAKLIKETYDVTLTGNVDPTHIIERPEYQAMLAEPTPRAKIIRFAAICRAISARLGPLVDALLPAAKSGDIHLQEFTETINRERNLGVAMIVQQVVDTGSARANLDHSRTRDVVWTLNSPEVYQLLTRDRGWSDDEYQELLTQNLIHTLLNLPQQIRKVDS